LATLAGEPFEAVQIQVFRVQVQHIAGLAPGHAAALKPLCPFRGEQLPEARYVHLDRVDGVGGWNDPPQAVDEEVDRHHTVHVQRQHGEHCALLRTTQRQRCAGTKHLERTKDPHLHDAALLPIPAPPTRMTIRPRYGAARSYPDPDPDRTLDRDDAARSVNFFSWWHAMAVCSQFDSFVPRRR
jgi:hypothetical protein